LHRSTRAFALCALLLSPPSGTRADLAPAPIAAQGDGFVITVPDVEARLAGLSSYLRAQFGSPEGLRKLLDLMINAELAAGAAERAGYSAGKGGRSELAQRIIVDRFHDPEGYKTVSDADVRAYYDEHRGDYVQPVKARISSITFEAPKGSPDRAARKREAGKLRDEIVRDARTDPDAFLAAVARIRGLQAPGTAGEPPRLFSLDDLGRTFTPEIAKVAWDLLPGTPSKVLESPRGFHILQGFGGQPPMNKTADMVRPEIQVIIQGGRMSRAYQQWIQELREQAHVRVDEGALAKVRVDLRSPPAPAAQGG
jgi:hypothetical protein